MSAPSSSSPPAYRGRIAPSPTGYLHAGHARTFWTAHTRARQRGGTLVLRNEDLDPQRSKPAYVQAMFEDLRWLGINWDEGPDIGGAYAPYAQSQRTALYLDAWRRLLAAGAIYPCQCSRRDVAEAASAPHENSSRSTTLALPDDDEPHYPGTCRGARIAAQEPAGYNWRFRVPDGEAVCFHDGRMGATEFTAGRDFGDFAVWRRDGVPAYQLAVVVDDAAMRITEVVRGADLLKSTARQILLQRALRLPALDYYHCALMTDERGARLAKRHDALSLRALRASGVDPATLREKWARSAEDASA